jgi:heme/copper-type cytochrome/quinol oxidase subunit 2
VILLVFSVRATRDLHTPAEGIRIQVTGHQWWWDVYYPDGDFRTANEIYVPIGQPVVLEVTSQDVIHSFWVPNLGGKMDLIPGIKNLFSLRAAKAGIYRGQCAEFCGLQHALMAFIVVALPPEEFAAWRESQGKAPPNQRPKNRSEAVKCSSGSLQQLPCDQGNTRGRPFRAGPDTHWQPAEPGGGPWPITGAISPVGSSTPRR